MLDDTPPIPRRRWKLLGYIFLAIVLFATCFYWQLVRRNPPIVISKKTTYITEPLDESGLPDYRQHLREQCRYGVTPDNNAAVLLWQATGPGNLDDHTYRAICDEIGADLPHDTAAPSAALCFTTLDDEALCERVQEWIASQTTSADDEVDCETIFEMPLNRPWTSAQFSPLAAWVGANKSALKLTVQASRRPRYYSPSTVLACASDDPLVSADLPGQMQVRELARGLTVRAMLHLGEGNPDAAWDDLSAVHRLSQLIGQGPSSVEKLFAVALHDLACSGTIALLHHGELSARQVEVIRSELDATPPFDFVVPMINAERIGYLEIITRMSNRDTRRLQIRLGLATDSSLPDRLSIDWNRALEIGNDYFDRYAAASRLPALAERSQSLAEIDAEIAYRATFKEQRSLLLLGLVSRTARSHVAANVASRLFIPPVPTLMNVQDRANLQADLTRTAVSLAEFRLQHGEYPKVLAELESAEEGASHIDAFSGEPFIYRRDDAGGYLLYSVFHNGIDDGGNDGREPIVDGEWADERASTDYYNDSDYVIRIPRPSFILSASPQQETSASINGSVDQ